MSLHGLVRCGLLVLYRRLRRWYVQRVKDDNGEAAPPGDAETVPEGLA